MELEKSLLYQYRNSTAFNSYTTAEYNLVAQASPINLINFFDIDAAVGVWLTQLSNIFNVPRVFVNIGNIIVLDVDSLDDPTHVLDGGVTPIDDTILRALLKARIYRNTAIVKSVDYINDVFVDVINPSVFEVVEGTKALTLNITLTQVQNLLLNALRTIDPKWFGCPAATSVTYNLTIV